MMSYTKKTPTPCLSWQAPASTQKTKRKARPAIRRSARWRVSIKKEEKRKKKKRSTLGTSLASGTRSKQTRGTNTILFRETERGRTDFWHRGKIKVLLAVVVHVCFPSLVSQFVLGQVVFLAALQQNYDRGASWRHRGVSLMSLFSPEPCCCHVFYVFFLGSFCACALAARAAGHTQAPAPAFPPFCLWVSETEGSVRS